jgi:putative SOS response-associated peptidase YedK
MKEQFGLADLPALLPRYNIAPSQRIAVIRALAAGSRELAFLHWGLIPAWATDPAIAARLINARAETAAEKPAFRAAMRRRRCLIPADGFYEWQKTETAKRPFFFQLQDERPFAMAGLWETWQGPDGPVESCTILTTAANELVAKLHERMPVILEPQAYAAWLDPNLVDPAQLAEWLKALPASQMKSFPVSRLVNSPKNETPDCIRREGDTPLFD